MRSRCRAWTAPSPRRLRRSLEVAQEQVKKIVPAGRLSCLVLASAPRSRLPATPMLVLARPRTRTEESTDAHRRPPAGAGPHPARRARKIAGAVSVAGMFLLTGCMAATGKTATTDAARRPRPTTATTTATTATADRRRRPTTSTASRSHDHRRRRGNRVVADRTPRPMPAERATSARWAATPTSSWSAGPRSLAREAAAPHRRSRAPVEPLRSTHSEVSTLNRHAGTPVVVSPETLELVERALDAWRLTRRPASIRPCSARSSAPATTGRSTQLGPAPRHGVERRSRSAPARSRSSTTSCGCPPGTGFDPGGIGKGLAADIVVDELRADGARRACASTSAATSASSGISPRGDAWTVAVDHPGRDEPIARVGIARRRGRDVDDAAPRAGASTARSATTSSIPRPVARRRATSRSSPSSPGTRGWPRCSPRRCCSTARPHHFDLLAGTGADGARDRRARPRVSDARDRRRTSPSRCRVGDARARRERERGAS